MSSSAPSPAERISRECLGSPVRALHRAVSGVFDEALRPHGVGLAQLNLLVAIEQSGERATPSLLARLLVLDKSSLSRDVSRLVERGWATRRPGDDDRSQRLALTASGRRLLGAALPAWEEAQRRVRTLLGDDGAAAILAMARRLRDAPAASPAPPARR